MEPKTATVLAVELPGFSDISATLHPKELNLLLKAYFELTETSVRMHQGNLCNFSGDSFLAFIEPKNNGTIPELLAIETTNDINERIRAFIAEKKLAVSMGFKAGIATGESIVGEIGMGEKSTLTIMGEAVNNATRLREFAENNQMLVCGKVFSKTKEQYTFQKQEPLRLRGSKDLLEVYELKEKKRSKIHSASFPERKIVSKMVGRSLQMEQLESLFRQLLAGKGSIVNIVGKAGIGKSRLMAEIKAQPIMEKMLLLEGRAIATGQQLSYHPIANLIRNWAGILEDDLPSVSADKLQQSIQKIAPAQADEIFSFTAKMMGLPLTGKHAERVKGIEGEALEKLILKNLRDLVISATRDKPRIYVIEDMHWSDQSSLNLFKSLYKLSLSQPVMFINVLRPGYADTGDYMLNYLEETFAENQTTIHLDPLDQADAGQLINNLLRKAKLPKETEEMIIRKTEGNPFFIEEVLRSFIDDGIIEIREGHFRITEKIKEANIPDTINDAILSRVDKLDEKTRELLNTASVMGRNFYYKVLEEATDTIEELDDRLAYLSEVQLITETKKKEEIEYLFKHALAQQLTYEAMMQQSRKDTHLKIAHSIEKVFAANINEFYGTLVHHYQMAEDKEKTIHYLILAGEEAMKSGASSEALQFFENALDTMPQQRKDDSKNIEIRDLRINIANMYHAVGRNIEAVELFEYTFEKYYNYKVSKTEMGILLRGIWGMIAIAFAFRFPHMFFRKSITEKEASICPHILEWGTSISSINPRHFVFKTSDAVSSFVKYDIMNSQSVLDLYIQIAAVFVWTSFSYPTVRKIIDLVDQSYIPLTARPLMSLHMTKSMFDANTGNWLRNHDFNKVFDSGLRLGELWMVTIYALYIGFQQIELSDYASVVEIADKIKDLGNSFENSHAIAQSYRLRAVCSMKFRKFEGLQELINTGTVYIQGTDHMTQLFVLYLIQAQLYLYTGRFNEAKKTFVEVEKSLEKNKGIATFYTHYQIVKIQLGFELANILGREGKNDKKVIRQLLKTSNKLISKSKKFVSNLTEAYLLRANAFLLQRKFKKASKNLQLAIQTGKKYNSRLDLSRAYFETGKFLSDPKTKQKQLNGLSGKDYLEKAKVMFEEMDLQWDLEEYKKYVNQFD